MGGGELVVGATFVINGLFSVHENYCIHVLQNQYLWVIWAAESKYGHIISLGTLGFNGNAEVYQKELRTLIKPDQIATKIRNFAKVY